MKKIGFISFRHWTPSAQSITAEVVGSSPVAPAIRQALSMPAKRLTPSFLLQDPSHYGSEMPIAAFSSGDASQYSYLCAALKSCCISFGVGGAGGLCGSNGRANSRKKL
jgi:hypothetical protein